MMISTLTTQGIIHRVINHYTWMFRPFWGTVGFPYTIDYLFRVSSAWGCYTLPADHTRFSTIQSKLLRVQVGFLQLQTSPAHRVVRFCPHCSWSVLLVVEPPNLKTTKSNWIIFPSRGENKQYMKPPVSKNLQGIVRWGVEELCQRHV